MNNFFDLAQLAKPTMMPTSPSPVHGAMYGADMGRHDQMLRQAQTLAALQAKQAAMEAEEKAAGHEGRMADIRIKSATSMDDEADLGTTLGNRRQERKAKGADNSRKIVEDQIEGMAHWIDSWKQASPEQKQMIHQDLLESGAQVGTRRLGEMSPEQLDQTMQLLGHARDERLKLKQEKIKQEGANTRADKAVTSRERIAEARNRAAAAMEQAKREGKPMSMDQLVASELRTARDKGEITDKDIVDYYTDIKTQASDTRVATTPPRVGIKDGKVVQQPVQGPAPVKNPLEGKDKSKDKFEVGKIYKDSKTGKRAKYLGQGKWELVN